MKSLQQHLNENLTMESLSHREYAEIEDLVKRLRGVGKAKFTDMAVEKNREELNKKVQQIVNRYDDYVEDVLWDIIFNDRMDLHALVESIGEQAEENEYRNGTEAHMIIIFLEEMCNYFRV